MNYKRTQNKNEVLILPRGYLSWSAIQTYRRSKDQFMRHYFYGEPQDYFSPEIDFGKAFAECIETRKKHPDPVRDMVIRSIPRLSSPEHQLDALIPSKYGGIKVIGKLDQYDPKTHAFDEFKTGMRKWTQNTAHDHGQMKLYTLMLYLKYGVIDSKTGNYFTWQAEEICGRFMLPSDIVEL